MLSVCENGLQLVNSRKTKRERMLLPRNWKILLRYISVSDSLFIFVRLYWLKLRVFFFVYTLVNFYQNFRKFSEFIGTQTTYHMTLNSITNILSTSNGFWQWICTLLSSFSTKNLRLQPFKVSQILIESFLNRCTNRTVLNITLKFRISHWSFIQKQKSWFT